MTVSQLGAAELCARKGCAREPTYRVLLGGWAVQVYACTPHALWAIRLNHIQESVGKSMGWERGYLQPDGTRVLRPLQVVMTLSGIARVDFSRDESGNISETYPQYDDGSDIPRFHPLGT